ncbi:MAG: hypothetical protein WCH34_01570 [Bacteroidota bacterium]
MKKPFPVKNVPVDPADVTSIKANISDSAALALPTNIAIPSDQKNSFPLSGLKKEGTVLTALQTAKAHPEIFPPTFSVSNFDVFYNNRIIYGDLRKSVGDFYKQIDDSYVAYGILESDATNNVYAYLKMAAATNPALEEELAEIEKFYSKGPRKPAVTFTVPAGGNIDVNHCSPGTSITNNGSTRLALNAGGDLSPAIKRVATIIIEPNNSVKIPTSYNSINIHNLSTTESGSFSVKIKQ